jgi:HEPN domain-containing protein
VNYDTRCVIDGWLEKASRHLDTAKEHLKSSYRISEAIQAAQECVELSVKACLRILEINFPHSHGWNDKQLPEIAKQIEHRGLLARLRDQHLNHSIRLPRLLFLANFWHQFYIQAKYGMEVGSLASAKDLFEKKEAEIAVSHADECHHAAWSLFHLSEEKRKYLLSEKVSEIEKSDRRSSS